MDCNKIQDLILTDYIDNQMDEKQKNMIETHLAQCIGCQEFTALVKKTVVEPFIQAERFVPSENVWIEIKDNIMQEQSVKPGLWDALTDGMSNLLRAWKPGLVFASMAMLILGAGLLRQYSIYDQELKSAKAVETMEYLSSVTQTQEGGAIDESEGFGTTIEKYFL
ncbi:MAG: zf-HC2 domain-containing protein [Candidatus Omnitrophica bacterium]|nr:zf-HC2 domain-containing protein [Candidatus Omnitrophota bacterium]